MLMPPQRTSAFTTTTTTSTPLRNFHTSTKLRGGIPRNLSPRRSPGAMADDSLPRAAPPPPPSPPPPPPAFHDTTLTLLPLAWAALPSSPRPHHARRPRLTAAADGFARVRSSPIGDTPAPCTECSKQFPSWKALFGHMRCHPERQWRGITPPPQHARDEFTVQEREAASGLLKLAGGRKKAKKSLLDSPGRKGKESTPASSSTAAVPAPAPATASKCDENHKCGVCHKGFATGQALGGHMRCHWEGVGGGEAVVAAATTSSNCSVLATSQEAKATVATAATTLLDLNLEPPGTPLPRKNNHDGSLDAMLDLKLGY